MFKVQKNGYVIELTMADALAGPGRKVNQVGCNSGAMWVRINEGTWFRCGTKSMHKVRLKAEEFTGPIEECLATLISEW